MKTFRRTLGLFLAGDRRVQFMKAFLRSFGWIVGVSVVSVSMLAQTTSASRYDAAIQAKVSQQLASKKEFHNVQAAVEDGIVTLSGSVDLVSTESECGQENPQDGKRAGSAKPDRGERQERVATPNSRRNSTASSTMTAWDTTTRLISSLLRSTMAWPHSTARLGPRSTVTPLWRW